MSMNKHGVEEAGRRWGHCARDAGWALESRIHVVADGAEWIRLQSKEVFGNQADFLVDFYHVSEYLAGAAQACRPQAPRAWLRTQQRRLKRGASDLVVQAMEPYAEASSAPEEEAPVRAALRYLSNRLQCLDYPKALAQELPIAPVLSSPLTGMFFKPALNKPEAPGWLLTQTPRRNFACCVSTEPGTPSGLSARPPAVAPLSITPCWATLF